MLASISSDLGINLAAAALWATGGASITYCARVFALDSRLSGRWEGDLECRGPSPGAAEFRTHVIRCVLVLARPIARQNSGLLYYTRECTATDTVVVRGLDELKDYSRSNGVLRAPEFTMQFTRRFHKHPDGRLDESTPAYIFRCRFAGLLARAPKHKRGGDLCRGDRGRADRAGTGAQARR